MIYIYSKNPSVPTGDCVVNPSTETADVANSTDKGLIRDLLSRIWRDESVSDLNSTLDALDAVCSEHGGVFDPYFGKFVDFLGQNSYAVDKFEALRFFAGLAEVSLSVA